MSEASPMELRAVIETAIAPELAQAETLLHSEGVNTFFSCVFPESPLKGLNYSEIPEMLAEAAEAGDVLTRAMFFHTALAISQDSSSDIQTLGEGMKPRNPNTDETDLPWEAALRWLKRGPEKLMQRGLAKGAHQVMPDGKPIADINRLYETSFPVPLTLLAFEALEAVNQDYELSMEQFQADAQAIQTGERVNIKSDDVRLEVYGRAMNMLKDFYFRGQSEAFIKRFMNFAHGQLIRRYDTASLLDIELEEATSVVEAQRKFTDIQRFLGNKMDEIGEAYGIKNGNFFARLMGDTIRQAHQTGRSKAIRKQVAKDEMSLIRGSQDAGIAAHELSDEEQQKDMAKSIAFLQEAHRILIARSFIDTIAAGRLDLKAVMAAQELLQSRPLMSDQKQPNTINPPEELLDWEVLPPRIGESIGIEREPGVPSEEPRPSGVDTTRVDALYEYINQWGEGYVARSRIPNLAEEKQYYLAILPQTVGGMALEHAIGDNPEVNRHAVFVWRAEKGIGRFGQVQQTWREVFRTHKPTVQKMGARRILHTGNLNEKIMEYWTRPASQLDIKRYFFK